MDTKKLIQAIDEAIDEHMDAKKRLEEGELDFYYDRIGDHRTVMYLSHKQQYDQMLSKIEKDDVVCDMGAGGLQFSLLASERCKKVYAVEMNPLILTIALRTIGWLLPRNLIAICADWRYFPIPEDTTKIVCMVNMPEYEIPAEWMDNGRAVYFGRCVKEGDVIEEIKLIDMRHR